MNDVPEEFRSALLEREYPVLFHDLDYNRELGPVSLLNLMQTTASAHSRLLGVSATDLKPLGLTWVLSRIHLRVERYPTGGELVRVRTWPALREGLFTTREFELTDGFCRPLGRASSSWALIGVATRRPVRLEGNLPPYPLWPHRAVDDDFASLPKLSEEVTAELPFRVLRGDLDLNQHVNNRVYARWALEALPDRIAAGMMEGLEISFRAEALYGATVLSRCSVRETEGGACCLHQIVNRESGRELARVRSRWRPYWGPGTGDQIPSHRFNPLFHESAKKEP